MIRGSNGVNGNTPTDGSAPSPSPAARASKKLNQNFNADQSFHHSIPFRDAEPGSGELPLVQLDDFYTPARDEKGSSQVITLSIPPFMVRQLELVVHSKRFPYLNVSDVVRHAIKRHLSWTSEIRASIGRFIVTTLDSCLSLCRDEEIRIKMEELFQRVEKLAQYYYDKGEHAESIRLLNTIKAEIIATTPGHWRDEFLAMFMTKWTQYMAGMQSGVNPFKQ